MYIYLWHYPFVSAFIRLSECLSPCLSLLWSLSIYEVLLLQDHELSESEPDGEDPGVSENNLERDGSSSEDPGASKNNSERDGSPSGSPSSSPSGSAVPACGRHQYDGDPSISPLPVNISETFHILIFLLVFASILILVAESNFSACNLSSYNSRK